MTLRTFSVLNESNKDQSLELRCDLIDSEVSLNAISTSDIRIIGQLSNSSNGALLGEIAVEDELISVVVKPSMYENPLVDFEWGTLAKREVAAFELSKLLGWNLVPQTVLRDVENMESSVQLFVPHDPREHYFTFAKSNTESMEVFAVFDYLINNADRKAGHILSEKNESFSFSISTIVSEDDGLEISKKPDAVMRKDTTKFYGIDHGLSFNVEDKLRTVIWEFSEQAITEKILEDISKVFNNFEKILTPYITEHEIEKTILRAEQILMNPFHYALDANPRAFPWPLV